MAAPKRYTLTTALPYANGPLHLGHVAGVYIPADIYARYLRASGHEVLLVGGSDEHGVPIALQARKEGVPPQEIVDRYHGKIKGSLEQLGISLDIYSRTSKPEHAKTSQDFFLNLHEKGIFEEKTSEQYFDPEANQFLADRYIQGTCPTCSNPNAYGDQCENCGSSLSPEELKDPRSMLSGAAPIKKETTHWYLPLGKYEKFLSDWILMGHKSDWKTNVYGQCKSWIEGGLHARAMTRDLDYGVPVPLEGAEGKVLYVWFDAPIGYISATKDWAAREGLDWEPWWKDKDTQLIHFIGKDNIVFHCIIFPVMLHAHGEFILPENVPANEFLNLEGDKFSTSRNWAVWLHEYLEEIPDKQDVLRYVLCANLPETKDNDFTWKDFQQRNNSELVAILGNFVNRTLVLTHKFFDGKVPEAGPSFDPEKDLLAVLEMAPEKIGQSIEAYRFREALAHLIDVARAGNKYLADTEPWHLAKTDMARVGTVLHHAIQCCASLATLMEPFLPFTAVKLREMLGGLPPQPWAAAGRSLIVAGNPIGEAKLLFEKIEDELVEAQVTKLKASKTPSIEMEPTIEFEDFTKLKLRVGLIKTAEAVEKSKKLLKLEVEIGNEIRTIVSGIAEHYKPEDVIGKQVSVLCNLEPRKLMGILSEGMILMAEDESGTLRFVSPEPGLGSGATIR